MSSKKSIAIIGAAEKKGMEIIHKIAGSHSRFLFVSRETEKLEKLLNELAVSHPQAETEIADCVKNSCWEADIIIMAVCNFDEDKMIGLIKEVATQKIVVTLSDKNVGVQDLHQKLPFSKLVNVDISTDDFDIRGEDMEAVLEIRSIFQPAVNHY